VPNANPILVERKERKEKTGVGHVGKVKWPIIEH
jgi:hypothetical protein